ncbi:hypothetical protein E1B28_006093 [Marasmius oreades]|uniref:Uncharacterized protein n=1 Tax=Marasmius oreades TaxID=181124 RepID=A0A9P7UV90_9AGAR|nr:uncharacterized protein E1B28_006093 [Marasmius oreades]KAG7095328.1 hypothetical protein E1B28_006093 [Marasmius oreades]
MAAKRVYRVLKVGSWDQGTRNPARPTSIWEETTEDPSSFEINIVLESSILTFEYGDELMTPKNNERKKVLKG